LSDKEKNQDQDNATEDQQIEDAEVVEELHAEDVESDVEADEDQPSDEAAEEVQESDQAEVLTDPSEVQLPAQQKSSVIPMVIGGAVAAALGFGAAVALGVTGGSQPSAYALETRALIEVEVGNIAYELERIEGLTDQSGLRKELAAIADTLDADLSGDVENLKTQVRSLFEITGQLSERIDALESRPLQELASDQAVAAYEAELAKLQEAVSAHRADIEQMAADARAMEAAARQEALKSQGAALITDVTFAVNSGASFTEAVAALEAEGASVPQALKAQAAEGVPTQAALIEAYPEAARAALRAVRQQTADQGGQGGVMAFLQDQLGVRSVAPKDGNDADAVLSRAEAALKAGDLASAFAELDALPSEGQAEMTDWIALATRRAQALDALSALKQDLNGN